MNITVLVDNYTYLEKDYKGEAGASYYIEIDGKKILLDAGFSDVLISNAEKANIDLEELTHIIISHGHDDHTRGLMYLDKYMNLKDVELITHPDSFLLKRKGEKNYGSPFTEEEIMQKTKYITSKKEYRVSENCVFLGEIPRLNEFEKPYALGQIKRNNAWEDDYLIEDSAVICNTEKGVFIISGCSHSGICNIIDYGKKVGKDIFGTDKIVGVLGGFHLSEVNERVEKTVEYIKEMSIEKLYPCHCNSFKVKAYMEKEMNIETVGIGTNICI